MSQSALPVRQPPTGKIFVCRNSGPKVPAIQHKCSATQIYASFTGPPVYLPLARLDDVLEHDPVGNPPPVTSPRMPGIEGRRFSASRLIQQRMELDPDRLKQA